MATARPYSRMYDTDAAGYRAWVSSIHNAILACGLVQTADTGQADPATINPVTSIISAGYCVYRFNDALQVASPIYLRIDWSHGNGSNVAGLWISVGTGTDGAGNLTGATSGVFKCTPAQAATAAANHFVSAEQGYFALACIGTAANNMNGLAVGVERIRSADGSLRGDGYAVFAWCTALTGSVGAHRVVSIPQSLAYPARASWPGILGAGSSWAFGNNVGVSSLFPVSDRMNSPATLFMVGLNSDFLTAGATTQVDLYGSPVTYITVPRDVQPTVDGATGTALLMRWE